MKLRNSHFHLFVRKVQETILYAFYRLNCQICSLNDITPVHSLECHVSFELGAREEDGFNFLDEAELGRVRGSVAKKPLLFLDFLCVVRCHVTRRSKPIPLRFDYHLLRFAFHNRILELRVTYERGTHRIPLEDLITFLAKRIDQELSQNQLKPLNLGYSRTL